MSAQALPTVAARVPVELRARLESIANSRQARLTEIIVTALTAYADRIDAHDDDVITAAAGLGPNAGAGTARTKDPATAKKAALDVAPRIGTQRRAALEHLERLGDYGGTADDVVAHLETTATAAGTPRPAVNGVARRVTDLLQGGLIAQRMTTKAVPAPDVAGVTTVIAVPVTRPTRHGAAAQVYAITPLGRDALERARKREQTVASGNGGRA